MVCLVEESSHRAAKQRSNPVDPVLGEVAKDSSWTEAVGWLVKSIKVKKTISRETTDFPFTFEMFTCEQDSYWTQSGAQQTDGRQQL